MAIYENRRARRRGEWANHNEWTFCFWRCRWKASAFFFSVGICFAFHPPKKIPIWRRKRLHVFFFTSLLNSIQYVSFSVCLETSVNADNDETPKRGPNSTQFFCCESLRKDTHERNKTDKKREPQNDEPKSIKAWNK